MEIIEHRINSIKKLLKVPKKHGVEIDLRTQNGDLILQHDPLIGGEAFIDWISHYEHGTLILNVKEEGLENYILPILQNNKIEQFFFLDQSIPFLIKTALSGERRCSVRWSEYENLSTTIKLAPLIDWVWIDCFTTFPFDTDSLKELQSTKIKTCLVAPELQGRFDEKEVLKLKKSLLDLNFEPTAICTKRPLLW